MKKLAHYCLVLVVSFVFLFSASCGKENDKPIAYTTYTESNVEFKDNHDKADESYNKDLYFRNDLTLNIADPFIVYDEGYYYAYGTYSLGSFPCFRSTNLTDWKSLSNSFSPSLTSSWGKAHYWAPDIIKIGDKWYMYYTATDSSNKPQLGVAVADKPYGPFTQFTGKNGLNETITVDKPPFAGFEGIAILDSTMFQDDDGSLYMYFSVDTRDFVTNETIDYNTNSAEIWGVKMIDPVTWDISTMTRLLKPGYKKYADRKRTIDWETWSPSFGGSFEGLEGPYMIKSNGKYYLTYSANSFIDVEYMVGYAVCDTPLGAYDKPNNKYLDNMLLGVPGNKGTYISNRYMGFMTGTGHSSIFKVGNEYMFAYHAHKNRDVWGKEPNGTARSLAVDYLRFDSNGVPYTSGPTYSLISLPEETTNYKNLSLSATINADGENAQYLNDNYTNRAYKTEEVAKEANFEAGTKSIEIKFSKPVSVKAINVFNSYDFTRATSDIEQIDFGNDRGIVNVLFNQRYFNYDQNFINPHSAYNVELAKELVTDRIVITFKTDSDFSVGEVQILGREV